MWLLFPVCVMTSYWLIVAFCWQFDFCCCFLVLHCCKHMRLSCALNHLLTYLLTYLCTGHFSTVITFAQLTCDLLAIAKFLVLLIFHCNSVSISYRYIYPLAYIWITLVIQDKVIGNSRSGISGNWGSLDSQLGIPRHFKSFWVVKKFCANFDNIQQNSPHLLM